MKINQSQSETARDKGFFQRFFAGLMVGMGMIAPGVSGGVMAVLLGLYDRIVEAVAHPFRNFKKKAIYLFPVALGAGLGVLLLGRVIDAIFAVYPMQVKFVCMGLVLGSLPAVFKQATQKGFTWKYTPGFLVALGGAVFMGLLETGNPAWAGAGVGAGFFQNIFFGILIGLGTVIPGVSASLLLMIFGGYQPFLHAMSAFDFSLLIPAGIGLIVCVLALSKLVSYLLREYYSYTYFAILGFVVGSVAAVFPGLPQGLTAWVSGILSLGLSILFSYWLQQRVSSLKKGVQQPGE